MAKSKFVLGIDVGTLSARAGIFDLKGKLFCSASQTFPVWYPAPDYVEQSSDAIWQAISKAIQSALKKSGIKKESIIGLSFDATCSLVALDEKDKSISISPTGKNEQNIIVWMDHRAIEQVNRINATRHPVLRYVGYKMSPEMETPKLLWIKENLPSTWRKAARYLDLADYLAYRATGNDSRSLCTTVCKWTYQGHKGKSGQWDEDFFKLIGLGDLLAKDKIGNRVLPMGTLLGGLTEKSAKELGLSAGTAVGVGIIDAHAGGLGVIGTSQGKTPSREELETRLALIGGTSSCHMAVSRKPLFIKGIWGPYYSAMIPGMWLTEGGQSATGALIDTVIQSSIHYPALLKESHTTGKSIYELLNNQVEILKEKEKTGSALTRDFHVLDYYHGNRSPRADASARGMVTGYSLDHSMESLARQYYATIQAIAYGTRHIIQEMNKKGYRISQIHACGGGTKNHLWLQEHADITGCKIVLPKEPEAVLLGTAMLGAVAAGKFADIPQAMAAMSHPGKEIKPDSSTFEFHAKKFKVYQALYDFQQKIKTIMK
jgi:FGGY-family pentulose kinase